MSSSSRRLTGLFWWVRPAWLLFLVVALPARAQAQFTYATNNGAMTIVQYTGPGGDVVIPDNINGLKVTTVGSQAFFQANSMRSLTFGTNMTTIMLNAVFQCPGLTTVIIPQSVTNIGDGPFVDCKGLTTIALTGSNAYFVVTNGVLFDKSLRNLIEYPGGVGGSYTISDLVTNTGEAFIGNSLTSIEVNPLNEIYASTNGVLCDKHFTQLLAYPGAATDIYTVPNTISSVASASFEYSTGLTAVTMGTNVINIGFAAFYDCSALTSITLDSANAFYTTTNGVLYDKAKTALIQYPSGLPGVFSVPNTVTNISDGAFGDAFGLTSVIIPDSVTNIGVEAFYSCINLSSVTLGANVSTIQQAAFFYCPALKSMVFPSSLTSFGLEAFAGCQNLTNACFEGNQPTDGGNVFLFDTALRQILYVKGTTGWGATYAGILASPCPTCGGAAPMLTITKSTPNVLITWPSTFTSYTLQSTTDLASRSWNKVSLSPAVVGNLFSVTDSASNGAGFYRLAQ